VTPEPSRSTPLAKATVAGLSLVAGALVVGYVIAPPLLSGMASVLGFDELAVTGPNDVLIVRLKLAAAFAVAPAAAWLASTAGLIRGRDRWGLSFAVTLAFVALAVAAGMAAKLGYMYWAVSATNEAWGYQQPMVLVGEVAPGSWGLAAGVLAAMIVIAIAALRPAPRPGRDG